jgi:hypothetical protein
MDQHDYSSHYSGQSYSQYSSTSSPHSTSASYPQQYYQTSSGSEQGTYDYEATSPVEEAGASSRRRSRGGTSSASGSTPTTARRREQNRLAQRALRQRRDTHIRTLEDRILHTSLHTRHLASENRDLSHQLQSMAVENDTLRRTSVESTHAAAARAAAVPAYNPYAQGTYHRGGVPSMAYSGAASPYNQSPYSSASTPSSTGDPSPSSASWPYDDPSLQGQYDPRYWSGQQDYSAAYAQQNYEQYEDEEAEEEEEENDRPSRGHRRRK